MQQKLKLALLYNLREITDPKDPRFHLYADLDDQESIEAMVQNLKDCGYSVLAIEANEEAYLKLYKNKKNIDLVFNYSLGKHGESGYAQLPAMLEMLQIPYTGSSPLTQALVMNKAKLRAIAKAKSIPVLDYQVFKDVKQNLKKILKFPLIVKPIARGSSAGITNESVVEDEKQLKNQVTFILENFSEPALVEPFLEGREFSIAMLGNPPEFLPIIEPDFSKLPAGYKPLDSLDVKWIFEEVSQENHLLCPAPVEKQFQDKLLKICIRLWEVLEIRDLCRIDIRCDRQGNPFVLDVNSPPGLLPPEISETSYLPLEARVAGIKYQDLLKKIVNSALDRYQ